MTELQTGISCKATAATRRGVQPSPPRSNLSVWPVFFFSLFDFPLLQWAIWKRQVWACLVGWARQAGRRETKGGFPPGCPVCFSPVRQTAGICQKKTSPSFMGHDGHGKRVWSGGWMAKSPFLHTPSGEGRERKKERRHLPRQRSPKIGLERSKERPIRLRGMPAAEGGPRS